MSPLLTVTLWLVTAATIAGILIRPWRIPEWIFAVAGAALLVAVGAIPLPDAYAGLLRGANVYAFLLGIVLLAEIARSERLFDYLAVYALRSARGSRTRLFTLIYGVGIVVTALLSNDTTAVILTPAVLTVPARTEMDPLPYLYACAFIASAASFILPISNPANLVIFGDALPALLPWLASFGVAAFAAIALTYGVLRVLFRTALGGAVIHAEPEHIGLNPRMRLAFASVGGATLILLVAAAFGIRVGPVALAASLISLGIVTLVDHTAPLNITKHLAWQIVPLVAGLFVLVEGLDRSGALAAAREVFAWAASTPWPWGTLGLSGIITLASNAVNNLPVGLAASYALSGAHVSPYIEQAAVIAVDLGPNVSVTGSLATLLWLIILRRAKIDITAWQFFRYGIAVTVPALVAAVLLLR
ncbi:MAG: SLC13 family permease [Vulcanimicrobiaceae bacterium]